MAYFIDNSEVTKEEFYSKLPEIKAHAAKVNEYVIMVKSGEITLDEVPVEYYEEVYSILNTPEPEEPEPTYTLDQAAALIAQEVAESE